MKHYKKIIILTWCSIFPLLCPVALANSDVEENVKKQKENKKIRFNTAFITDFNKNADISWLEEGGDIQSGRHPVEIHVNGKKMKTYQVSFIDEQGSLTACVPAEIFDTISLDNEKLPEEWLNEECINLVDVMEGATSVYDYDSETLNLTIPQIYLLQGAEGFIDPSRWDEGLNALSVNYALSGSNVHSSTQSNTAMYYGNLQTLLRLGAWRFTTLDTLSGGSGNKNSVGHLQAYAQRAIGPLLSELSLGDLNTTGEFFDTTSLRGVLLRSDERMLPWTIKGYAPEIRGLANSNAIVTIKQNNNILYEQNVPPGEFNINSLNALGYGGDLEVTVTESDGTTRSFRVPYSSVPQLLRKGYFKYSVASGEVRRYGSLQNPSLLESTLQYGLSNELTLYGGGQVTYDDSYLAINSGIAFNTSFGAVSADISQSYVPEHIKAGKGQSGRNNSRLKFALSKLIDETGTNLTLAGYHQLGEDYYTLNEYLSVKDARYSRGENWQPERYRNRIEVSINQKLAPDWGEVSLNGWWERHNTNGFQQPRSSYLLGYRNSYEFINYNLSINKNFTALGKEDTSIYAGISLPFGSRKIQRPSLRAAMGYSSDETRFRTSISGSDQRENSTRTFNSYFSQSSQNQSSFGINLGSTGSALQKSLSYSRMMTSDAFAANLSGAMLVHGGGVNFASYLGETSALVYAPGAEGATIMGNKRSRIGVDGYGLVPYLTAYEENILNLNTKGASLGFDTEDDGLTVIPTSGAIVKAVFKNNNANENSVLARIKNQAGEYLPFGSRIYDKTNNLLGTVGQSGIVIVSLPESYQPINALWTKDKNKQSCTIQPWSLKGGDQPGEGGASVSSLVCQDDKKDMNK